MLHNFALLGRLGRILILRGLGHPRHTSCATLPPTPPRFIRKHDDVFELIFSKDEGRSLPRIRLRNHENYERADRREEEERRRRECVILTCLKQYLEVRGAGAGGGHICDIPSSLGRHPDQSQVVRRSDQGVSLCRTQGGVCTPGDLCRSAGGARTCVCVCLVCLCVSVAVSLCVCVCFSVCFLSPPPSPSRRTTAATSGWKTSGRSTSGG